MKCYLSFDEKRPTWAYITDILLGENAIKRLHDLDPKALTNTFLQDWDVQTNKHTRLPKSLTRMIKIARKHKVQTDAMKIDDAMKRSLPA